MSPSWKDEAFISEGKWAAVGNGFKYVSVRKDDVESNLINDFKYLLCCLS